jgi:hypothetical protein
MLQAPKHNDIKDRQDHRLGRSSRSTSQTARADHHCSREPGRLRTPRFDSPDVARIGHLRKGVVC